MFWEMGAKAALGIAEKKKTVNLLHKYTLLQLIQDFFLILDKLLGRPRDKKDKKNNLYIMTIIQFKE